MVNGEEVLSGLKVHESTEQGVYIAGLSERELKDSDDGRRLINDAMQARTAVRNPFADDLMLCLAVIAINMIVR